MPSRRPTTTAPAPPALSAQAQFATFTRTALSWSTRHGLTTAS